MEVLNKYGRFNRDFKEFGCRTWIIKNNILILEDEENEGNFIILSYVWNKPTDDNNKTINIIFDGNINECLNYIKNSID